MAANTRPVCLTQYLRYGDAKVKRKDLELSLDENEINYYICRNNDFTQIKEDFELLTQEGQGLLCLAIIHTQNGFACLEALVPDVSVPLLGRGFDGQSASTLRVKPTVPGELRRSTLQLRPGEPFYIQDLFLTLVPEESHEHLVQLASGGAVPSYEDYSQHVSQIGESQALTSPSPRKSGRENSALLETPTKPKHLAPGRTPFIRQMAANGIDGNDGRQEWPQIPEKSAVLHTVREVSRDDEDGDPPPANGAVGLHVEPQVLDPPEQSMKLPLTFEQVRPKDDVSELVDVTTEALTCDESPSPHRYGNQGSLEIHVSCRPETSESLPSDPVQKSRNEATLQPPRPLRQSRDRQLLTQVKPLDITTSESFEPSTKRRKFSSQQNLTDESQDSLTGKTIEVATQSGSSPLHTKPQTPLERSDSTSFHKSVSSTRTPPLNRSLQGSPANSIAPTSSMRSTRSTVRESPSNLASQANRIKILFALSTSVGESKVFKKFLTEQGVKVVQDIKHATCLCIGKGKLKKTSKLISAVLLGVDVITDDWVTDSSRLKELQDIRSYLARDPQREAEWGVDLDEAIKKGKQQVQVFKGWKIIFTALAKKELGTSGFADLKDIVTNAGAANVGMSIPKNSPDDEPRTLIIGTPGDADRKVLKDWSCYTKDIIGLSVLRGQLDVRSDEFLIQKCATTAYGEQEAKAVRNVSERH